jgi:hypothetical protein
MRGVQEGNTTNTSDGGGEHVDQNGANARLMAAAPELLAALKNILPLARAYLKRAPSHPGHAKIADAYDAIEKAEGRAQTTVSKRF